MGLNPQRLGSGRMYQGYRVKSERQAEAGEFCFYESENGDRWLLVKGSLALVRHEANGPSGGYVEELAIGSFLAQGDGPEQQALLRKISSLAD